MISDAAGGYADSGPGDGNGAHELRPEGANANGRNGRPGHGRRTQTTPQPLHHRLSFDDASGVIMLPEGEGWLDEDSDSEDDYGSPSPPEELASPPLVDVAPPNLSRTVRQEQSSPTSSPAKRRSAYSTYYHHPERRTRTVPGAFEAE